MKLFGRFLVAMSLALSLVIPLALAPASATVNSTASKTIVLGNGAATVFSFNFVGVAAAYISVIYTDASGNETVLAQGSGATQYQISLNAPVTGAIWGLGGSVTYNPSGTPIPNGSSLTIFRTLPLTQAISLQNQNSLARLGNGAETGLDIGVMQNQQNSETLARAIVAPIVDATPPAPLPPIAQRANQGAVFDSQGNLTAGVLPSGGVISSAMQPVVSAGTLALARSNMGLGNVAVENIGAGLQDDGSGNLRTANPLVSVATNQAVDATFNKKTYIATGPVTFTLARANTLGNAFSFQVFAVSGVVTLTPNAADNFSGSGSGVSYSVPQGTMASVTTDGATNAVWYAPLTSTQAPPLLGATVDNLLPNVQWQQTTGVVPAVKQNATGTGVQTPASCASFTTVNHSPTFTCANTQQIKVGDLVVVATANAFATAAYNAFWGFTSAGYISCNAGDVACQPTAGTATSCTVNVNTCYLQAGRVTAVVTNTSITVAGDIGGVSPAASSAVFLFPVIRGDTAGGTSFVGPDGWTKTVTLISSPDDFSTHSYAGAIRSLLLRKGASGQEVLQWSVPANQLARFAGRTMSCGGVDYQTVQGGSNTWTLQITDSSGSSASSNGTGAGFGGYEFRSVARTIAQNPTSVTFSLVLSGNSGDVHYFALPTCGFVPAIVQSQLHQNAYEQIQANGHCNPPLLTPLVIGFSGAIATGLYGYLNIDLDAISFNCYDKSLGAVWAKIEWTTGAVGADLFTANNLTANRFGPQATTQVSGVHSIGGPSPLPLGQDGTFIMYTGVGNLVPTAGTFDFWDGVAAMPSSVN